MKSSEKIKICFLLLAAHILISIFTIVPGYLSIDEATYHMMTKNFSESGGFEIWNGYREYPSTELESIFIFARNGRLVSQYPYLYPILCTPFYRIWGYHGMFFINVIAFIGIVFLCYAIAQKLFNDRNMALNACLIFVLATFSWEYSQAAWPHATSSLFIMAAFYIFICSFHGKTTRIALLLAMACGFITGLAVGIRMDSIFVLPCFIIAFLFLEPRRPGLALSVCLGALPGLLILSATNYAKFGVFSPFSYGRSIESSMGLLEIMRYLPFAGLITVAVAVLWVVTRYPALNASLRRYKRPVIFMTILLIVIISLIPRVRKTVEKPLNGAYQLIVDFRVRDLDIKEGGLSRSQGGGMVYIGGLKKSLLQSCPYLVMLLIPFFKIVRHDKESVPLIILFLIPLFFISFYSYHNAWHGGMCLNLRYFVPILPFTSILSAYAWRELSGNLNGQWGRIPLLLIFLTSILFLVLYVFLPYIDQQEFYCLTLPLLLAFLLTILLPAYKRFAKLNWHLVCRTTVAILFFTMVWSGLMAFCYDYTRARHHRQFNLNVLNTAAETVSRNSILFTNWLDPFLGLIERGKIRIASPSRDNLNDFNALIEFHIQKGHSVYAVFQPTYWEYLRKKGLLDRYKVIPLEVLPYCILSQLKEKSS